MNGLQGKDLGRLVGGLLQQNRPLLPSIAGYREEMKKQETCVRADTSVSTPVNWQTGSAHGATKKRETSIFISVDIFLCQEPFSSSPGSSFFHTLKIICQSLSSNFGQEQKSSGGILSLTSETLQAKFNGAISARTKTFGPF